MINNLKFNSDLIYGRHKYKNNHLLELHLFTTLMSFGQ